MAVEDKYIDAQVVAGEPTQGLLSGAGASQIIPMACSFLLAAADDDGSIYRLFKGVNPFLIPWNIKVIAASVTSGTDFDLGMYEVGVGGAAIDADALADGLDLSSASTYATSDATTSNGTLALTLANYLAHLYELAGLTVATAKPMDICLTGNTVGSAAVRVVVLAEFVTGF